MGARAPTANAAAPTRFRNEFSIFIACPPSRVLARFVKNQALPYARHLSQNFAYENRPTRSVQRRRDRDPDHDHGARAQGAARGVLQRARRAGARTPELPDELHLSRHLLEQSSSP